MASQDQAVLGIEECVLPVGLEQVQSTFSQQATLAETLPGRTPTPSDRSRGSATPAPGSGSARLTEEEKVKLVRLCVLHQGDGNKKAFWGQIRYLLKEDIGKDLRDPQQVVNALATQFQRQIKKE